MPINLTLLMHQDVRAISSGHQTNAVSIKLLDIETPGRIRGIHPKYNYISVDFTGKECKADVCIYTDGSKTENHVGAGMVALKDSREIHIEIKRLKKECSVFQAELCGIKTAIDWIQSSKSETSYAIYVDSTSALHAIANKHTRHPLAVEIRTKTIELSKSKTITSLGKRTRRRTR